MVRKRCGMGVSGALTLWKWKNCLLLNEHYSLKTEWNLSSQSVLLAWLWPLVMLNQSMNSFVKWNDRLILSSILLISSDNLSVGEESCESAIPWILDLISFVVISIILSTRDMEWPSWLLLFIPSHQNAIFIQSIFSNPSIRLIHRVETTSIESTYLETWFLSIHHAVIHLDS